MANLEREEREHHGLRVLFMIVYWFVLRLGILLSGLLAIVQWILGWFRREDNDRLRAFCRALGRFQHQILDYLLFNTEQKPYPFADWPADPDSGDAPERD